MADPDLPRHDQPALRVVAWGTYDLGKPRVRILLRGLRENGVEVIECHRDVWDGIEDKSRVSGWKRRLRLGLRWLLAYPPLIYRYLRLPDHDAVLVGYMGQLDVLMLWPFSRIRRKPIVWDAFLSLYDTIVEDRRFVGKRHPLALGLYALEWLSCRAADRIILDTNAHGAYFSATFGVPRERITRVIVGAETDVFAPVKTSANTEHAPLVLFYGQFIPLHGIEYIVQAAKRCEDRHIRWMLIGRGQEEGKIRDLIAAIGPSRLDWIDWVSYPELVDWINRADVCLGIFGKTDKARRVIPNKVFQILATGKPLITMDSPAARELLADWPGVSLIPPADPNALAETVCNLVSEQVPLLPAENGADRRTRIHAISSKAVTGPLVDLFAKIAAPTCNDH